MTLLLPADRITLSTLVCQYFGITMGELQQRSQTQRCVIPRQVVFYLLHKHYGAGYAAIARDFEKDHGTVRWGVAAIEGYIASDVMCSQVDSLASRSVLPGSKEARKMTAISGRQCATLFRSASPLGCCVKMLLESSTWHSTRFLLIWKTSTTRRNRLLFRLVPLGPRTTEIESGFYPTPCAGGPKWGGTWQELGGSKNRTRNTEFGRSQVNPVFWEWMLGYPKNFTALAAGHWETQSCIRSRKSLPKPSVS